LGSMENELLFVLQNDCRGRSSYLVNIGDIAENEFLRTVLRVQENEG
jgi:hypothetical protein